MGTWATRDAGFRRTSGASQADSVASVATDTLGPVGRHPDPLPAARRPPPAPASTVHPTVRSLQAVASRPVDRPPGDEPAAAARQTLNVPRYSQMTHRGQYPQYGGGGQAWCSPTSLSMILGYYRALPTRRTTPG